MNRFLIPVLAAVLTLFALVPSTGTAQSPDEYQVAVSLSVINLPVFQPGVPNLGAALKSITALANGQPCATVGIANATEDRVLLFGGSGLPEACSTEGATVTFRDGNGLTLSTTFTLSKGKRDTLSNLAPLPPSSQPRQVPESQLAVNSNEFQVLLPAIQLRLVIPTNPAPAIPSTLGSRIGLLTAFADGDACASLDVSNLQADVIIRLGLPDQPAACSTEGATVTFTNSRGQVLMGSMVLRKGARETLNSFSPPVIPPPNFDKASEPTSTPRARTISVTPPDTGDAGLR